MNFLAHLWLAGDDEGLRLGAMLGDFTRGNLERHDLPASVTRGILLHRFIDQAVDGLPEVVRIREAFPSPFRRYGGIVTDLAFDHELARRWNEHATGSLANFDREVRELLDRHEALLPDDLKRFMRYADRRGLFDAYRIESEILHSLRGIGRRLSRPNPLHRVDEIWDTMKPHFRSGFEAVLPLMRERVDAWLGREFPERQSA